MKKLRSAFGDIEFTSYYIKDKAEARAAISKLLEADFEVGGLDLETAKLPEVKDHKKAGLCPLLSKIRLLQIYTGKAVCIFDLFHVPIKLLEELLYAKKWYAHYGVFEIQHLTHAGFPDLNIGCTMLLSKLLHNAEHTPYIPTEEEEAEQEDNPDGMAKYKKGSGHSLEDVTGRYLGLRLDKTLQISDWGAPELSSEQVQYAAADAVMTLKLSKILLEKVTAYKMQKHYALLEQMQHVVADMQLHGFPVDWKMHEKLVNKWDDAQSKAGRECYGYFGDTNLNSGPQLGKWLEKFLRREPEVLKRWPKTGGGKAGKPQYKFDRITLGKFKGLKPIQFLLEYKQYSKLLNTYGESFAAMRHPVTGRIHTEYTLGDVRTGRLSARKPNLQQWPSASKGGDSRAIFTPGPGRKLVVADFSQIEVRFQAEISRDPEMRRIFREGRDIYCEFGSFLFERKITKEDVDERKFAKAGVLSLAYGMGPATFQTRASLELGRPVSRQESERVCAGYKKKFFRYVEWCNEMREKASNLGYIRTPLGKVRKLAADELFTRAPNTVVQGGSAEIMMISLLRMRKQKVLTIGTIHDEGVGECREGEEEETIEKVNAAMNGAFAYMFPKASSLEVAEAHAGDSWHSAKD
jgi:DNA polymerase-1